MRYERLNEHYIIDTYTGMKLNQKKCIEQLNNYEEHQMMEMNKRMNNHKLKKYCTEYIRNCAILNHLNKIDAPYTERYSIIKEMENITEQMKKELKQ